MATSPIAERRFRARHSRQESRDRIVAAASDLIRERSYEELSVGDVMDRAGIGRTLFYRHFDDLAELLLRACREAIDEVYEAQRTLAGARTGDEEHLVRQAIEPPVDVYQRHGPLLRALNEAAASDEQVAAGQRDVRRQFDELVEEILRQVAHLSPMPLADPAETAHALNLMNEAYLLDAFGREPRVSRETAVQTLTEIWAALIYRRGDGD
jgi:TetR/AcrR family transcriptional regulator, ethionamide resistance regulator